MGHIGIKYPIGSDIDLNDIDILTFDDGSGVFEILFNSEGDVLFGDFT
jgi:hypothetical protein